MRPVRLGGDARELRGAQQVEGMQVIDGIAERRSESTLHLAQLPHHLDNPCCSRVCCMYSLKFAHLVREKLPEAKPATATA